MAKKGIDKNQVAVTAFIILAVIVGIFIVSKDSGNYAGEARRITEGLQLGVRCSQDYQCLSQLCLGNPKKCTAPLTDGRQCNTDNQCRSSVCHLGRCAKSCGASSQCGQREFCFYSSKKSTPIRGPSYGTGYCRRLDGIVCTSSEDCVDGKGCHIGQIPGSNNEIGGFCTGRYRT